MAPKGYLAIVLHAHLPYVRHPEHEYFLEENWFFEAVTETYVPILQVLDRLVNEGVPFRLTISLSPTLVAMFNDRLLRQRCRRYIHARIELCRKELRRTERSAFYPLAQFYLSRFESIRETYEFQYHSDLARAFKTFQDLGVIEIMTCAATHCYLPLFRDKPEMVRAQVKVARESHRANFGCDPKGIWLPECGYFSGVEDILHDNEIRYFFVDTHGIEGATPKPQMGIFSPIFTPACVAAFGRDTESSKQVWSSSSGYPGDFSYREFYRDIGYDLDFDYIKPYIHPDGIRVNTAIKYHRITGKVSLCDKGIYDRQSAMETSAMHAGNFMFNRERQVHFLHDKLGHPPIVVSPYDAELFGHWWFEGPDWLYFLLKKIHYDQNTITTITPSEYLTRHNCHELASPHESSWGLNGYSEVWVDDSNDWIYPHLHKACDRMKALALMHTPDALVARAKNQALRELFLATASDWAFIMKTQTTVNYAVKRTHNHLLRFNRLYDDIVGNRINPAWLAAVEARDNIFPDIHYSHFSDGGT